MAHLTSDIVTSLSWALVHALWQGLLLYILLRALLAVIPGNYASARYIAAVSALALLSAGFLSTIVYYYTGIQAVEYTIAAAPPASHTTASAIGTSQVNTYTGVIQALSSWFNTHTALIVNIYLVGMVLLLVRIAYNLFTLNNLKYSGTTIPGSNWTAILNNSMHVLGVNNNVQLYFSSRVLVPAVMGTLRPVILVPVAIANKLSTAEAEAILLHELAHIRRHDYLVNMVQLFIETILFYNPFVWLISSIVRKEREHCCDDMVVRATTAPLPYAKALATLETYRQQPALPALAATGNNHQLLNRIKRIMEMKNHNVNYGQLMAVLLAVVLLAGAFTFLVPDVHAQSKKEKKKETVEKTQKTAPVKKHIVIESAIDTDDDGKKGDKQLQKSIVIVKDGDTVKNLSINKSMSDASAAMEEALGLLEELKLTEIIDGAMAGVDWKGIDDSVNAEMNMNAHELSEEVRKALVESRKAMAEARKEVAIARKEYTKAMAEARKEMAKAHGGQADARVMVFKSKDDFDDDEIYIRRTGEKVPVKSDIMITSRHDKLLKSMEKDGLIDRENGYKIEKKGNELYIDGIKQSKEVFKKYEPMIDMKNLTIKGNYRKITIDTRE